MRIWRVSSSVGPFAVMVLKKREMESCGFVLMLSSFAMILLFLVMRKLSVSDFSR